MNSPKSYTSPTYKNLKLKHQHSPKELKEKLRKDFKSKVQNCRDMLLNRFRGDTSGPDIQTTLTEIYKDVNNFPDQIVIDDEESEILEEIKNELIQEELEWWLKEYEKSQVDVDWSLMQQEENVICPICQKTNFTLVKSDIHCPNCKITIRADKSLLETKQAIFDILERHNNLCTKEPQFTIVTELNITHIYLICDSCSDMQLVL